jgi:hypothetical protein
VTKKREIADEMTVLLRQLVMQNTIRIAGHVLQTYFLREWKIHEELANSYVRCYFAKYFPRQLERYLMRQKQAS